MRLFFQLAKSDVGRERLEPTGILHTERRRCHNSKNAATKRATEPKVDTDTNG